MKNLLTLLGFCSRSEIAFADPNFSITRNRFTPPASDLDYLCEVFVNIIGITHSGSNIEGGKSTWRERQV